MRRISMATRDELVRALSRRYSEVRRIERSDNQGENGAGVARP